jgi:hypothetical protein
MSIWLMRLARTRLRSPATGSGTNLQDSSDLLRPWTQVVGHLQTALARPSQALQASDLYAGPPACTCTVLFAGPRFALSTDCLSIQESD